MNERERLVEGARRGHRIMIVDDCVDTAELMCTLLRTFGHDCRPAHSRAAALDVAAELAPSVAFVDLSLPDGDGCEVARALRAAAPTPYLVALTGWSRPTDRARTRAAGFDRHVVKPIDRGTLDQILRSAHGRAA